MAQCPFRQWRLLTCTKCRGDITSRPARGTTHTSRHDFHDVLCECEVFEGQAWMSRQLQVGLVGGSVATVGWKVLEEIARLGSTNQAFPSVLECPLPEICDCVEQLTSSVHLPSLLLGCLIGLSAGPLIDTLYCLRVWWSSYVRSRLRAHRQPQPLYRILS